jgi:hypothetical protein
VNYRNYVTVNKRTAAQGGLDYVAFLTDGDKRQRQGDAKQYPHIKCFKCNQFGQYKSNCPNQKQQGGTNEQAKETQVTLTTMHVSLTVTRQEINPMWTLCDSESTVDVFKNRSILTNIRKTRSPIRLKGKEGQTINITEMGDFLGYGSVY